MLLFLGDCLEIMKTLPDASIDMVLADPPYGTTSCKWDTVIPFEPMWRELKRIRKDNTAVCLFGSEPFSSHLRMSNIKEYRYDWIWEKTRIVGPLTAKLRPMKAHEVISIFSKLSATNGPHQKMSYFPQGLVEINRTKKNNRRNRAGSGFDRPCIKESWTQTKTNYPKDIIKFKSEFKTVHETQKPVALLEYLIKTYTKPGETVLDFCMGSGSTGLAAMNAGRDFIGIEKDEKYFEIAKARI
jgi:site-specific DNA-methyltransferase (adenine-specific)